MSTDPTWDNVGVTLWTLTEFNAAILCASLPVLRPLLFKASGQTKKNGTNAMDFVQNSALRLREMKFNATLQKTATAAPQDSSEELVTATIDEMIYGPRWRQSSGSEIRRMKSFRTTITSDDYSAVELGLSPRQEPR